MEPSRAIAEAAMHTRAALLVADQLTGLPAFEAADLRLILALTVHMLGDPADDPAAIAAGSTCSEHLEHAAAALDTIPAASRPAGLLNARCRLATALQTSQQLLLP